MRARTPLATAVVALLLAACAGDATAPQRARPPAGPSADGGVGMFGSGGYAPPPDTTQRP
jgi:hypothetical protein